MSVIDAQGLFKVFGRKTNRAVARLQAGETRDDLREQGAVAAVIDATFSVEQGEIFVVMGLSGSGKSTLIRMVNGLLLPTAGSLRLDGHDLGSLSAKALREVRRQKVSMVFQHFALLPHHTVGQNAAYGLKVKGVNRADREAQAEEALALVGLGGWGGSYPHELSGGMRQRVGLARALAARTDVLLMDEAFSALDPLIRREMQDQLVELQHRLGKTVLFITHDLNEAMRLGDRIAMMRDGRIVQLGSAEEILNDPANDYVARFVQDVDRTRVLTAGSVMENPVAVLGSQQGPRAAHRLMREHQVPWLMVVDRQRSLIGVVRETKVATAVDRGQNDLTDVIEPAEMVAADTTVLDLLTASAETPTALAVVGERDRLLGVVPRVTLLNALGAGLGNDDVVRQTGEDSCAAVQADAMVVSR